MRLVGC